MERCILGPVKETLTLSVACLSLVSLLARKEIWKRNVTAFISSPLGHALDVKTTLNKTVLLASLFSECQGQN